MHGFASASLAAAAIRPSPVTVGVNLLLGGVALYFGLRLNRGRRQPPALPAPVAYAAPPPSPTPASPPPTTAWPAATNDPGDFFGTGTTVSAATPTVMPGWAPPAAATSSNHPGGYPAAAPTSVPARGGRKFGALVLCTLGVLWLLVGVWQVALMVMNGQRHTVALPATAQTFHLMTPTAQMQQALDNAKTSLPSGSVTKVEAGYYTDGSGTSPAAALVVADVVGNPNPDDIFSGFRTGASSSGVPLVMAPADTQGMGGRMECGTVTTSQGRLGVCLWVDRGTVGVVLTTPAETSQPAAVANMLRHSAES